MELKKYCQYTKGFCNQDISTVSPTKAFFIYPSKPTSIASTIGKSIKELSDHSSKQKWLDWKKLPIHGKVIFCEICKAINFTEVVIADITTLNFNVLFELGYAIGNGKPVIPIRDTTYERDKAIFDALGIFDTLGYYDFQNSKNIVSIAMKRKPLPVISNKLKYDINHEQPIYYIKSPIDTDASIKLNSCLKRGAYNFRTFDPKETPRLSLHEAYKQIKTSFSVVAHLVDPHRRGAEVHNALSAFVCGMALADKKIVLMLNENAFHQPIDYRDIIVSFTHNSMIPTYIKEFVRTTADHLRETSEPIATTQPLNLLEKVDIGDVAAENEINSLHRYFIKTPEYLQAVQGHARIVTGRKGTGKTALFYSIIENTNKDLRRKTLILDLKPEGHQFIKLKENVLNHLSEGVRLHTLTALWNYILLLEFVRRILNTNTSAFYETPESVERYTKLKKLYQQHASNQQGDFSERLMGIVEKIIEVYPNFKKNPKSDVTQFLYQGNIQQLNESLAFYLAKYDEVWLLIDNIDKGWSGQGVDSQDIAIIRCLLEATRKLQRALENEDVDFKSLVFIRKDVYDLLVDQSPDRGKESVVNLEWSDEFLIKDLLKKRFNELDELTGKFENIWTKLFDPHVGGENSFLYIQERTFFRPRDILNFTRKCLSIAISRGHTRVTEEDILLAEKAYSEDMLEALRYEIRDVSPNNKYSLILQLFMRKHSNLSRDDLELILMEAEIPEDQIDSTIDQLMWFSFIGIKCGEENRFSYQVMYNIEKLKNLAKTSIENSVYCIHPAFKSALELT